MKKYPQADLSKLPDGVKFPIVHLVITPDVLFDKNGMNLSGIGFVKKFLNLHQYGLKNDFGFSDPNQLLVKVSILACKKPEELLDFLNKLEKAGFEEYFDQSLFGTHFIGDDEYARTELLSFTFEMLKAHLFLSVDDELVKYMLEQGFAAGRTFPKRYQQVMPLNEETVCNFTFDFDGVVGDAFSEELFEREGLFVYNKHESDKRDEPLTDGPLANFVKRVAVLRSLFPKDVSFSPIQLDINTARGSVRQMRVFKTLEKMKISPDRYYGTCGLSKGPLLHASGADIFFDDSIGHVENALKCGVFGAHVPFGEKNKKKPELSEDTPEPCQKTVKAIKESCEGCCDDLDDDEEDDSLQNDHDSVCGYECCIEPEHDKACACDDCLRKDQLSKQARLNRVQECKNCTIFVLKEGLIVCAKCSKPSEKYNKQSEKKQLLEQDNLLRTQKSCGECSSFFTASDQSLYCTLCGKTADKTLVNYKFYCSECNTFVPNNPDGKIICTNCDIEFIDSV